MKIIKNLRVITLAIVMAVVLSSCAEFNSKVDSLNGQITGNTYECQFYSNDGQKFMTVEGQKIDINSNIVSEKTYNDETGWGYTDTLSSVVTLTVDGHQLNSCGSTILFVENGLTPDVDFIQQDIESSASGIGDNTIVANVVNKYKNAFGKPVVVVIQSQLGDPICAYSGKEVYWEVCEDLPKTTKLMIDDKALYIHRANFQTIDLALLNKQ